MGGQEGEGRRFVGWRGGEGGGEILEGLGGMRG